MVQRILPAAGTFAKGSPGGPWVGIGMACAVAWAFSLVAPGTAAAAEETVLYGTDFSEFEVGLDKLAPNEGWMTTNPGEGVHGIAEGTMPGLGRSGFLGGGAPATDWVSVYRPLTYDPLVSGTPEVHWSLRILVEDSTNRSFDSFFISLYNENEDLLAALVLDNSEDFFGYWRYDGVEYDDMFLGFDHDAVVALDIHIDFAANRWTVILDGVDLFRNEVLYAGSGDLNLGDFSVDWELIDDFRPGNNRLYFDEWQVSAIGPGAVLPGFELSSIERLGNGDVQLTWPTLGAERFRVEYSAELLDWKDDLPGSLVTVGPGTADGMFVDPAPGDAVRYYRVRRLENAEGLGTAE